MPTGTSLSPSFEKGWLFAGNVDVAWPWRMGCPHLHVQSPVQSRAREGGPVGTGLHLPTVFTFWHTSPRSLNLKLVFHGVMKVHVPRQNKYRIQKYFIYCFVSLMENFRITYIDLWSVGLHLDSSSRFFKALGGPIAKPHRGRAGLCPDLSRTYLYISLILFHSFFPFSWNPMCKFYLTNCPEAYLPFYFAFTVYLVPSSSFSFSFPGLLKFLFTPTTLPLIHSAILIFFFIFLTIFFYPWKSWWNLHGSLIIAK